MMKVLMVASEAAPFAKTGGLADVVGALPPALQQFGVEPAVVLPRYRSVALDEAERVYANLPVLLDGKRFLVDIFLTTVQGVPFFLIENRELYDRDDVYGDLGGAYWDNPTRFAVLCQGALAVARHLFRPDIFHCHDWQGSLVPVYLRHYLHRDPTFFGTKCVLSIHNIGHGYQGRFGPWTLGEMGLDDSVMRPNLLEFYGDVCLLKGGIVYSDAITTVSRKYAEEIQTPEFGAELDGLLRARAGLLTGIINGVDYTVWNPETDPLIAERYSATKLAGKAVCKRDLLEEFGLPPSAAGRPLVGVVSRLAWQKGFDLVEAIRDELLALDVALVVLGTGEERFETMFQDMAAEAPDRVAVRTLYDDTLAHRIEAGADMFLMPSRYEPCGLNQIYSLRYGTLPIVRATGGLDDTIDGETGFKFLEYSGSALLEAIREALTRFKDKGAWRRMMLSAMRRDFSWSASARQYAEIYRQVLE